MLLPPTYVAQQEQQQQQAKDTTAKRYNCERYFYTQTHTWNSESGETARAEATTSTA